MKKLQRVYTGDCWYFIDQAMHVSTKTGNSNFRYRSYISKGIGSFWRNFWETTKIRRLFLGNFFFVIAERWTFHQKRQKALISIKGREIEGG